MNHAPDALYPLRFRNNLVAAFGELWRERELIGRTIEIGEVTVEAVAPIIRCGATHVRPGTAIRDLEVLLPALSSTQSHKEFGVFTVVTQPGTIRAGDPITIR